MRDLASATNSHGFHSICRREQALRPWDASAVAYRWKGTRETGRSGLTAHYRDIPASAGCPVHFLVAAETLLKAPLRLFCRASLSSAKIPQ